MFWSRLQGHYRLLDALGYSYDVEQIPVDLQTSNKSTDNKIAFHALANPAFENLELNVQSSTGAVQGNQYTFLNLEYIACLFSLQGMVGQWDRF